MTFGWDGRCIALCLRSAISCSQYLLHNKCEFPIYVTIMAFTAISWESCTGLHDATGFCKPQRRPFAQTCWFSQEISVPQMLLTVLFFPEIQLHTYCQKPLVFVCVFVCMHLHIRVLCFGLLPLLTWTVISRSSARYRQRNILYASSCKQPVDRVTAVRPTCKISQTIMQQQITCT